MGKMNGLECQCCQCETLASLHNTDSANSGIYQCLRRRNFVFTDSSVCVSLQPVLTEHRVELLVLNFCVCVCGALWTMVSLYDEQ